MSRDLTSNMAAEIVKTVVRPLLLLDITLADNSLVYYWTGVGLLSWNGQTYTGSGNLIGFGAAEETDDIQAQGVAIEINGVPLAAISMSLSSLQNGKTGIIRLGMMDSSSAVISTPKIIFRGRLDGSEAGGADIERPKLTLTYENELADLERAREWRWTDEHQKKFYSGDRGLEHIAALQDAQIPFGNKFATSSI